MQTGNSEAVLARKSIDRKSIALNSTWKFIALCLLCISLHASAQDQQVPFSVKVATQLVVQTVTVTDKDGKPIEGLHAEDFILTEDNLPQVISVFEFEKLDDTV